MFRIDGTFLRSKFGQRLFVLFVACALIPILALLLVSYRSVSSELEEQAEHRLQEHAKSAVMALWERLSLLEVELQLIETAVVGPSPRAAVVSGPTRITSAVLESESGDLETVAGTEFIPPALNRDQDAHLLSGKSLLYLQDDPYADVRVLLARRIQRPHRDTGAILWVSVEPAYLWWGPTVENTLPAETHLHVFASEFDNSLLSTTEATPAFRRSLPAALAGQSMGNFEWLGRLGSYRAHFRVANTRPLFGLPSLTFVVSEAKNLSMQPFLSFKRNLVGIVLLSVWVILLLTMSQIRRHLVPLEVLQKGTQQIAAGQLETRVEVETNDELADLASSFNSMADNLDRQFRTLTTSHELVQTALSSLNSERIVETVLTEFHHLLDSTRVVVTLIEQESTSVGHLYGRDYGSERTSGPVIRQLNDAELVKLNSGRDHLFSTAGSPCPTYFLCDQECSELPILALPIALQDQLVAVVAADLRSVSDAEDLDLVSLRHVADQVAVALANARLVDELDALSWGTLTALARTIDVRSHWTMGHSERVMDMAQSVGQLMGLTESSLHTLLRASLLHDIGKIGIPAIVLDKEGSLTPEEKIHVREHVRIGVQILRPVPALRDVLPVVAQHHERFDGSGYPAGLAGDEICLEARILAAVDCYDALRSDRPYRAALSHDAVVIHLLEGSGKHFDPDVIAALLTNLKRERATPTLEEGSSSLAI